MGQTGEAQVVEANRWLILRGLAVIGYFSQKGGYAGLCDAYRAVAKHQDDDRILVVEGGAQTSEAFEVILRSVKFKDR